ncbi:MAG: hypothetical protein AABX73_03640 [Nanoarchaeota archaeon]
MLNKDLAQLAIEVVCDCQEKCKDPETGLNPDFGLSFHLDKTKGVLSGSYTPILNHLGYDSNHYIVFGEGHIVKPWTDEDFWRFLKQSYDEQNAPDPLLISENQSFRAVVGGYRAGQIIFAAKPNSPWNDFKRKTKILSGGSRQGKEVVQRKMKRPWQNAPFIHSIDGCPFCRDETEPGEIREGELRVLNNIQTPYDFHKLIVPTRYTYERGKDASEDFLYDSSGFNQVLDLSQKILDDNKKERALFGVHIGFLGGQNLAHLHYHLTGLD